MTRPLLILGRSLVYAWIPVIGGIACTVVLAQEASSGNVESPGIHLSIGVLSVIIGIVAFIGPGFYLLGRYDHRLSSTEAALLHVERQMESMVERSIHTGERIATAIETMVDRGVEIECHGPKKETRD